MKYALQYVLENKYAIAYFLDDNGLTENKNKAMQFNSEEEALIKKRELDKRGLEGTIKIVKIIESTDYSEKRFKTNLDLNNVAKRYLKPDDYGRIVEYKFEHIKIQIIDIVPDVSNFFLVAKILEGSQKGKIGCFHTDTIIW